VKTAARRLSGATGARAADVYVPSEAERADPALYAANVRDMMLRVGGFKPSPASLQDSRAYIALLQARAAGRALDR